MKKIMIVLIIFLASAVIATPTCCYLQSDFLSSDLSQLAEAPLNQLTYYFGVLLFHDLYLYAPISSSLPANETCLPVNVSGLFIDNVALPNIATPAIDASFLYGTTLATRASLRTFAGGRLNITAFDELSRACDASVVPKFTGPDAAPGDISCAGDPRAAESLQLLALQTLWVLEHNRHADRLAANKRKKMDDEAIFQAARQVVVGMMQKIALYEWLPAVLGSTHPVPPWRQPAPSDPLTPDVRADFSQAWVPFFASGANDRVLYSDQNQELTSTPLSDGFYNPSNMHRVLGTSSDGGEGVCTVLTGMLRDPLQRLGPSLAPSLAGVGQWARGCTGAREANISTFAQVAGALGVAVATLSDITKNPSKVAMARALFPPGTSDATIAMEMELGVGLALEDHGPANDDVMGPVARALLVDQLTRHTRNPDAYWYENPANPWKMKKRRRDGVLGMTLAQVISANCKFVESLEGPSEFSLWSVSDVKVVVQNNNNLNQANLATVWTQVALVIVVVVALFVSVVYYLVRIKR